MSRIDWRIRLTIFMLCIVGASLPICIAESAENPSCIILVIPNETYVLSLESIDTGASFEISLTFDRFQDSSERLKVIGEFDVVQDTWNANSYYILSSGEILCTIQFKGIENVYLGEERSRLEITSSDYFVHLRHIQMETTPDAYDISPAFQIVLALCSLIPFFLLTPDTVEELQEILEIDMQTRGVYGRILVILLPLLSIAITVLLLESLTVVV